MLLLAHMSPPLVPALWAVFAAGLVVGAVLGYRIALRKSVASRYESMNSPVHEFPRP